MRQARFRGTTGSPAERSALRAAIAAGIFGEPGDFADQFAFGLDRILDGIGVLVTTRE